MGKHEKYRLYELKTKLLSRRRAKQFGVFVLLAAPLFIAVIYLLDMAGLPTWAGALINIPIVMVLWFAYFYLFICPLEKRNDRLRRERALKHKEEQNAS